VIDDEQSGERLADAELVARARGGDAQALDLLVRKYHASTYRLALSWMRDPDAAEDVVQDVFVKVFRGLDGFRGDASLRTWLFRITVNEAKGALRRVGRRREDPMDELGARAASGEDPAEEALVAREAERARAMLARLPEKQRLSVALRIDEGLSFRESGEATGSTEGAARGNYFHGIRRLRELMS